MTDMWDEPVDLDAAPDWAPAPPCDIPPEPFHAEVTPDPDEAAFWAEQRADAQPGRRSYSRPYTDWIAEQRQTAFTVPCPVCKVVAGQPCIRVAGNPPEPVHPPEPIRRYPAHEPRLRAARRKLTAR